MGRVWVAGALALGMASAASAQSGTWSYASNGDYIYGWENVNQTAGSRTLTSATQSTTTLKSANSAGYGSANLATGAVHARASSTAGQPVGVARGEAALVDNLTFTVAGANANTVTEFGVTYTFHGLASRSRNSSGYAAIGELLFASAGIYFYGNSNPTSCVNPTKLRGAVGIACPG